MMVCSTSMPFGSQFYELKLLFSNELFSDYPIFSSNLVLSTLAYPKLIRNVILPNKIDHQITSRVRWGRNTDLMGDKNRGMKAGVFIFFFFCAFILLFFLLRISDIFIQSLF